MWGFDLLLSGRKVGGQRLFLAPAVFQVSLAQNNPYVKEAYSQVAPSAILQYPPIKYQHVILPQVFFAKGLRVKHTVLEYGGHMDTWSARRLQRKVKARSWRDFNVKLKIQYKLGLQESMFLYSCSVAGTKFCINKVTRCLSSYSLAN